MKNYVYRLGFSAALLVFSSLAPSVSMAQETPTPEPTATSTPEPTATPTATATATPDPIDSICRSIVPEKQIPRCAIYKGGCQSLHIPRSDPRFYGISLIINSGCSLTANRCVNVYSSNGNLIGKMGAYLALYPYKNRNYSNYGCGRRPNGNRNAIDRKARRLGNGSIYLRINNQKKCLKIGSVKRQINSKQRC